MFIFVITLTVFAKLHGGEKDVPADSGEDKAFTEIFDKDAMASRQAEILKLAQTNLPLYLFLAAFNMLVIFVIMLGILVDMYLFVKFKRKESFMTSTYAQPPVGWGMGDIIKFALLFYSFGYIFLIIESSVARMFPGVEDKNLFLILNATIMDFTGIFFVIYIVKGLYGEKIKAVGLSAANFLKNVFYGIAGYVAVIPILLLTLLATAGIIAYFKVKVPAQPIVEVFLKEKNVPVLIYSSIFASIAGPVMEEIFFRGFMYNALKKKTGVLAGIMITSLIFSLLHGHLAGFVPIMALGILLAYLYEKTGTLTAPITVHIVHNMASLFLVFIAKTMGF